MSDWIRYLFKPPVIIKLFFYCILHLPEGCFLHIYNFLHQRSITSYHHSVYLLLDNKSF